jgi:Tfp pilus assembly protein FimT
MQRLFHFPRLPKSLHRRQRETGLSLLELLIACSLLAILANLALPNLHYWLARNESQRVSYAINSHLSLARSLALNHGVTVSLCGASASNLCRRTQIEKLLVFVDSNQNRAFDADEKILTETPLPLKGELSLNAHTTLRFSAAGTSNTPASFIYCARDNIVALHQRIVLSFSGRAYIARPNAQGWVEDSNKKPLDCS